MRIIPVLLLMTSSFALAACAGGGGGLSSGAGFLAEKAGVCTINENCDPPSTGGGAIVPPSTGGAPVVAPGSATGGNVTQTSTGNKTIALKKFVLDPPDAGKIALSQISSTGSGNYAATEAALLAKTPPSSLKFTVDTKTTSNTQWAVPEEMQHFDIGTRDLTWIKFDHTNVDFSIPANYDVKDPDGNQLIYDRSKNAFVYSAATVTSKGPVVAGTKVNHRDDFYWNQIVGYMGSKANGGAQGNYVEYRNTKSDPLNTRKEVIQLWNFKNSYVTNYENLIENGAPKQQAWSFGGDEATSVRPSGKANYVGRFVGNAYAEGFIKADGALIQQNGNWMLQGRSDTSIDFNTSNLDVETIVTPETWTSYQNINGKDTLYTRTTGMAAIHDSKNIAGTPSITTTADPDYDELYGTVITLKGKLVAADATSATPGVKNVIVGIDPSAGNAVSLNGDYTSSDQAMHGGLFGPNGDEITQIFSVKGSIVDPTGGTHPLTDPHGASLTISGAINGCVSDPVKCPP